MAGTRVLLILLFCGITGYVSAKKKVDCVAQKVLLDVAVDNMTMMMNEWETGFATIEEFNDDYCVPFQEWFKVFNIYKSCLKAFPRTLFAFVGTNIKKMHKEFCQTENKKSIAFNHLTCFKPSNKPFFSKISHRIKNFANFISNVADVDEMIPGFCCGYLNLTAGLDVEFEQECRRQGKPGSGRFMVDIVKALFVDAVDVMCGTHSKPEDCKSPKLVSLLDEMVTQSQNVTTFPFKSPVIPVLKILQRMDGKVNID